MSLRARSTSLTPAHDRCVCLAGLASPAAVEALAVCGVPRRAVLSEVPDAVRVTLNVSPLADVVVTV